MTQTLPCTDEASRPRFSHIHERSLKDPDALKRLRLLGSVTDKSERFIEFFGQFKGGSVPQHDFTGSFVLHHVQAVAPLKKVMTFAADHLALRLPPIRKALGPCVESFASTILLQCTCRIRFWAKMSWARFCSTRCRVASARQKVISRQESQYKIKRRLSVSPGDSIALELAEEDDEVGRGLKATTMRVLAASRLRKRTEFYLAVLREGEVAAGDSIEFTERTRGGGYHL